MKLYLSGKVSNLSIEDYTENFQRAADLVKAEGHEPINPVEVDLVNCAGVEVCGGRGDIHHWTCYMKHDLVDMLQCDGVALLPNWYTSSGAKIEMKLADDLKMPILAITDNYTKLVPWRHHV